MTQPKTPADPATPAPGQDETVRESPERDPLLGDVLSDYLDLDLDRDLPPLGPLAAREETFGGPTGELDVGSEEVVGLDDSVGSASLDDPAQYLDETFEEEVHCLAPGGGLEPAEDVVALDTTLGEVSDDEYGYTLDSAATGFDGEEDVSIIPEMESLSGTSASDDAGPEQDHETLQGGDDDEVSLPPLNDDPGGGLGPEDGWFEDSLDVEHAESPSGKRRSSAVDAG